MRYSLTSDSALVLIDVQQGFDDPKWGARNNPDAESNMARLLALWRSRQRPVIHVQHCSTEAGSPLRPELSGCAFKQEVVPMEGEPVFQKKVHSGFIGTGLEPYLRENGIRHLVVAGLTTDHCVSTTVRMAADLGFGVSLVSDAVATFDKAGPDGITYTAEHIHAVHLASLDGEFCEVVATDALVSE